MDENLQQRPAYQEGYLTEEPELSIYDDMFQRQPKLDRKRVVSLYDSFEYMEKNQNIIWMGPTGCGKSGLATAFLLQAEVAGKANRPIGAELRGTGIECGGAWRLVVARTRATSGWEPTARLPSSSANRQLTQSAASN